MENLRTVLKKHNFNFKKQFGQNFISDVNLLKQIVALSGVQATDTVIEIGLGAGTLTKELSLVAKKVIGYEIDTSLKDILDETLQGANNVEIVYKDVMKVPMERIESTAKEDYIVVANLPYYITTPILMRFIEQAKRCKRLVIMVQEEVADRFTAKENTAEYGSVTAAINAVATVEKVKRVSKNMFTPVPKVDSAVVRIDIVGNRYGVKDFEVYRQVLRCAFGNRRKMLVNNLMNSFKLSRADAEGLLTKVGVSLTARGETLSAETFANLSNALKEIL